MKDKQLVFTDEDLKRFRHTLAQPCPVEACVEEIEKLLARLEAAEAVIQHWVHPSVTVIPGPKGETLLKEWKQSAGKK